MPGTPVLVVDHATVLGGAEISLLTLLKHLDRDEILPHIAAPPGRLADDARSLNVRVHDVPLQQLRGSRGASWRLARDVARLVRIIRRERIALVHANTLRASVYAAPAARITSTPLLWHVHDIFPSGRYVRSMCRTSALAVAVSKAAGARLPCRDKVLIIYNGVELDALASSNSDRAAEIRRSWGVPLNAFLIGQVARLQPWKGQREFIAVAGDLLDRYPDVYFAIVGGDIFGDAPEYERELRGLVERRGFGSRRVFAGDRGDVPDVLHALDAIVHASDAEPFGRILVEAGAAGLPVVAYASGAVAELLEDQRTALIVPAGDRVALGSALQRLIEDPSLARELGTRARGQARRFAAPEHARQFERAYRRVLLSRLPT
jgi:glycosyltransferase involved in cell wall biosynthesis